MVTVAPLSAKIGMEATPEVWIVESSMVTFAPLPKAAMAVPLPEKSQVSVPSASVSMSMVAPVIV